jgi:predicted nucleic acid-binding protein
MTLIVSDNSPLNLLIRLGEAHVLPKMFASVVVPPAVVVEMNHLKTPQVVRDFISAPPSWLVVRTPQKLLTLPDLHAGEIAAISLAVELQATLMIDERRGRDVALAQGLEIVGVIGVLEEAANEGLIPDLEAVYAKIQNLRFHLSAAILNESLARHLAFKAKRPTV